MDNCVRNALMLEICWWVGKGKAICWVENQNENNVRQIVWYNKEHGSGT